MMPTELLIFLAIPILILFISKYLFPHKIEIKEMVIQFIGISVIVSITYYVGISSLSSDTEILNGAIISKERVHGTYEDPYDCMCMSNSDGSQTCSVCFETRYTVEWFADTTLGRIQFQKYDKSNISVYHSKNPSVYRNCTTGQPAAKEHSFDNYIKAVPDSLFNTVVIDPQYTSKLPTYPRVFNFYHLNRVINVDSKISKTDVMQLNYNVGDYLKTLGSIKQVNVIIVLTEIDDPEYKYSLEAKWLGGKKNDVIIVIGLDDYKITWVDTITFALNSGNEVFQVNMRDRLMGLGEFSVRKITDVSKATIMEYFDRPTMESFEVIKDKIEPPTYVVVLMFIFSVFGSLGLSYVFYKNKF